MIQAVQTQGAAAMGPQVAMSSFVAISGHPRGEKVVSLLGGIVLPSDQISHLLEHNLLDTSVVLFDAAKTVTWKPIAPRDPHYASYAPLAPLVLRRGSQWHPALAWAVLLGDGISVQVPGHCLFKGCARQLERQFAHPPSWTPDLKQYPWGPKRKRRRSEMPRRTSRHRAERYGSMHGPW